MRAVADAGPLIHLSWINRLGLLSRLFDEVLVPPAVRREVLASPSGTLGLDHIQRALSEDWLREDAPSIPSSLLRKSGKRSGPGRD